MIFALPPTPSLISLANVSLFIATPFIATLLIFTPPENGAFLKQRQHRHFQDEKKPEPSFCRMPLQKTVQVLPVFSFQGDTVTIQILLLTDYALFLY
ncbi:hypothetical protein [Dickeya lacustris]|uniref:Uncharacterized protein n=1 Tax=Dickeya lacustris TaxID=2259638 RepID=A0ABY8GCL1_9GAMM|nr:hypothetical protein [Dickeya lacustris]WFN57713.1 hypothetical protein O1Q98_03960 [Dickeya lacustris]